MKRLRTHFASMLAAASALFMIAGAAPQLRANVPGHRICLMSLGDCDDCVEMRVAKPVGKSCCPGEKHSPSVPSQAPASPDQPTDSAPCGGCPCCSLSAACSLIAAAPEAADNVSPALTFGDPASYEPVFASAWLHRLLRPPCL